MFPEGIPVFMNIKYNNQVSFRLEADFRCAYIRSRDLLWCLLFDDETLRRKYDVLGELINIRKYILLLIIVRVTSEGK